MPSTYAQDGKMTLGDYMPTLKEKSGGTYQVGAIQQHVTIPMGPPLLVNGATYQQAAFIAPCDGCFVKELWISAAVAIGSGTNTLAVDNYDKSASAARNALSTTNMDPTTITAKKGMLLTLNTDPTKLEMDEGDVLNFTLVCGTMTTAGQGYLLHAVVLVPDLI
jgi:hypothetical protein